MCPREPSPSAAASWSFRLALDGVTTPALYFGALGLSVRTAARDPHWVSSPLGTVLCSAGVTRMSLVLAQGGARKAKQRVV